MVKGAELENVIEPGFHWKYLRNLVVGGVECDRQELMKILELHRDTLKRLCLRDVTLKSTSWKRLLPEIRQKLFLVDVCICGDLYGRSEDGDWQPAGQQHWHISQLSPDVEYWDLSVPEVGDHEMRESINVYCRLGGHLYPNELPVTDGVVDKYYDDHVRGLFEDSEEEDDETGDDLPTTDTYDEGWEDIDSEDETSDYLDESNEDEPGTDDDMLHIDIEYDSEVSDLP